MTPSRRILGAAMFVVYLASPGIVALLAGIVVSTLANIHYP